MVQRPRPDLRGGCAAMRIPTVTAGGAGKPASLPRHKAANFLSPESRQSVAADLSSVAGMLAAYIDLPGLGVPKMGPF